MRLQYDPREDEGGYALSSRAVLPWEHSHECGREIIVVKTFNLEAIISLPSPLPRRIRTEPALLVGMWSYSRARKALSLPRSRYKSRSTHTSFVEI